LVISPSTLAPSAESTVVSAPASASTEDSFETEHSAAHAADTDEAEPPTPETEITVTLSVSEVAAMGVSTPEPDAANAFEAHPDHVEIGVPSSTPTEPGKLEPAQQVTAVEAVRSQIASTLQLQFVKAEADSLEDSMTEAATVRANPTPVVATQQSRAQSMGLVAAAVIAVAAMGVPLGVWLGTRHQPQPETRQAVPPPPAPPVQKPAATPAPVAPAPAPVKDADVTPSKPQAVAAVQPKAVAPVLPPAKPAIRTPAKTARKAEPTPASLAVQAVPVQTTPGLSGLATSTVVEAQPVVEAPRTVATPPVGRLFEPGDVDESPRVTARIEPQLPEDGAKRFPKDVVVVRVLVSQTGHPFRVSLLRRSLGGQTFDDAVVAAVSQWTFSPARKRGEAVSCWMNFGVPIGR
jgi:TonB family protein